MPALTVNADEREAKPLRWGAVLKTVIKCVIDAGFTLMHTNPVPLQLPWQQEPLCNAALRLLLQLIHQFFPFSGEGGMLFAQTLQ